MKRIIRWGALWQLIAVFALAACTADEWEAALVSGTADVVQITASIASQAGTRMQVGDKGNEAFQLNDQMSLFVIPKEQGVTALFTRTLELTATGWSPELTWQEIKSEHAKFTAFYPLVSNPNAETFVHSVATDQRTKEAYAASDLLSASVEASKGAPVTLEFQHRLSLIALHLTSEHTFTAEQLEPGNGSCACLSFGRSARGRWGNLCSKASAGGGRCGFSSVIRWRLLCHSSSTAYSGYMEGRVDRYNNWSADIYI